MTKMWRVLLIVVLTQIPVTTVSAADQRTQDLYKSRCQGCHGANGNATAIGKRLGAKNFQDPAVERMSQSRLAEVMEDGKNKMPAQKDKLTEDEIKDLARYIKELAR